MPGTQLQRLRGLLVVEAAGYVTIQVTILLCLWLGFERPEGIQTVLGEEGPVEWATFGALLACVAIAISRISVLHLETWKPRALYFGIALGALFVAMEEISWGQRIFAVEPGAFFSAYNLQGETNLHNLGFGGFKVNIVLFGFVSEQLVVIYLLASPHLFRESRHFRAWAVRWAVPIPCFHHGLLFIRGTTHGAARSGTG